MSKLDLKRLPVVEEFFYFKNLFIFLSIFFLVLRSTTVESVCHTQGPIEPNFWNFSHSMGVKLNMTVSHSIYYRILATWVQSISWTL